MVVKLVAIFKLKQELKIGHAIVDIVLYMLQEFAICKIERNLPIGELILAEVIFKVILPFSVIQYECYPLMR
jgi:hypothetical protein